MIRLFAVLCGLLILAPASAQAGHPERVLVFAAASTTDAVTDICGLFQARGLGRAVPSFAASSTLAKQIEQGAPAGVFLCADQKWMDYLAQKGLVEPAGRVDLLGNRLALIAPAGSDQKPVEPSPSFDLSAALGGGRLALCDPDHMPAGIYGRAALESLGLWETAEPWLVRAKDVRAVLALVERGECPLGIVYGTDAAISDKVKVVGLFPEDSHPPIVYPAALISGQVTPVARAFFDFLRSPEAGNIFKKYGFTVR
ncbi:MAG: molybdate ABC transporter substrate-binding protein [Thermodesulfobacteriota bacterium]